MARRRNRVLVSLAIVAVMVIEWRIYDAESDEDDDPDDAGRKIDTGNL